MAPTNGGIAYGKQKPERKNFLKGRFVRVRSQARGKPKTKQRTPTEIETNKVFLIALIVFSLARTD